MQLFIGININSEILEFTIIDSEHNAVFSDQVQNNLNAAISLKKTILKLNQTNHYEKITIGLNISSAFQFHPLYFLQNDDDLTALNIETVVVMPKNTKHSHEVINENDNSQITSYEIANYLKDDDYEIDLAKYEQYSALQRLTRNRYDLAKEVIRIRQHLLEILFSKTNKLNLIDQLNDSTLSTSGINLFDSDLTIDQIINMSLSDLTNFISKQNNISIDFNQLNENSSKPIDVTLTTLVTELRALKQSIKDIEKSISEIAADLPECKILTSIPGIDDICAAGIVAEIKEITRFEKESSLANYAGLTGSAKGTDISNSRNGYLRYYLVEAANRVRLNDPVFQKYYDKKYKEVEDSPMKRTLTLTARKLIRVIFVLLERKQLYISKEK